MDETVADIRANRYRCGIEPVKLTGDVSLPSGQDGSQNDSKSIIDVVSESWGAANSEEAAQMELLVSRDESGDLQYVLTLAPELEKLSATKRRQLSEWLEEQYRVTDADLPELISELGTHSGIEVFELGPSAGFRTVVPKFTDSTWHIGEGVAKLGRWLDSAEPTAWVLQVLCQPCVADKAMHAAHQGETCLQLNIRCAVKTEVLECLEEYDDRSTKPRDGGDLAEFANIPRETRLRAGERTRTSGELVTALKKAQIRKETSFIAPDSYSRGYLIPPQQGTSLRYGIGGVDSPWHDLPAAIVRHLFNPELSVGVASLPTREGTRSPVGLSQPGVALIIDNSVKERLVTLKEALEAHVQLDSSTIVITSSRIMLRYCAGCYDRITGSADGRETLSAATLEKLMELDQKQRYEQLRSWLIDGSSLYLIDLPDDHGRWSTDQTICSDLRQVLSAINDAKQDASPVADVIVSEYPESQIGPPFSRDIREVIRMAQEGDIYLTAQTSYPTAADDRSPSDGESYSEWVKRLYPPFRKIAQNVDLLLTSATGPVMQCLEHVDADWIRKHERIQQLVDAQTGASWVGVRRAPTENTDPVAVPVSRPTPVEEINSEELFQTPQLESGEQSEGQSAGSQGVESDGQHETNTETSEQTVPKSQPTHAIRTLDEIAVTYDEGKDGYVCEQCRATQKASPEVCERSADGLVCALTCCHSLAEIDRDAVRRAPSPQPNLSAEERAASELTQTELEFLKLIHLAQNGKLDPVYEYDPVVDSCLKLREDLGIDSSRETELADAGYLISTDAPMKVYSLTAKGLQAIGEDADAHAKLPSLYRKCLQRATYLALKAEYDDQPGYDVEQNVMCDVAATSSSDPSRAPLDVAVRDPDGQIETGAVMWPPVAGVGTPTIDDSQAEQLTLDEVAGLSQIETVIRYQTLVSEGPETMLWCVWRQQDATELLSTLEAADEEGRIEFADSYRDTVRTQDYQLDEPGITDVKSLKQLLDTTEPEYLGKEEHYTLDITGGEQ